jgi:hypothetical protein
MVKLACILGCVLLTACAGPKAITSSLVYDSYLPAKYALTDQHKRIHVSIDDKSLQRPEPTLKYESLKLDYAPIPALAQMVIYVHMQPSFFVQRPPVSRQVVEFDENNKGTLGYVVTNRGFIRTPFSIELVDTLNDVLVYQTQGNGNYPIDAPPKPVKGQTKKALLDVFYQQREQARQTLLADIWQRLKGRYLADIQVVFSKMQFKLVSWHEDEPAFKQAFMLLKKNDKSAARQALVIYNQAYKRYQANEDDASKQILSYLNQGITVATQIANDPNPQRYQP